MTDAKVRAEHALAVPLGHYVVDADGAGWVYCGVALVKGGSVMYFCRQLQGKSLRPAHVMIWRAAYLDAVLTKFPSLDFFRWSSPT